MWYAVIGRDVKNSLPLRKRLRAEHLARLEPLSQQGRVLVAGPMPVEDNVDPTEAGFCGSIMIVDFPSLEAATAWADMDPYVTGGVFASVEVKPFMQVLPA